MAQLSDGFGQVAYAAYVRVRKEPAMSVHRQLPAKLDAASLDKKAALTFLTKSIVFQSYEDHGCETIIELRNIDVRRGDSRHFKGLPRSAARRSRRHAAAGNYFAVFAGIARTHKIDGWLPAIARARSARVTIIAAAPSEINEQSSSRKGSAISGEF